MIIIPQVLVDQVLHDVRGPECKDYTVSESVAVGLQQINGPTTQQ